MSLVFLQNQKDQNKRYQVLNYDRSMSSLDLRQIEKSKIDCTRKFFRELGRQMIQDNVKYDVVTDYGKLMEIVSRP